MVTSFSLTWDYRCPFARNMHEHVVTALEAGAAWDVGFVPFSLSQAHLEEGEPPVWDDPARDSGLTALQLGVAVRDHDPDHFLAAHRELFSARHDQGLDLRDRDKLTAIIAGLGVDTAAVLAALDDGSALATVRAEHEAAVTEHEVWGVPTFLQGDQAVFVRVMNRPGGDADVARLTVDRVLRLLADGPDLNEYKHTTLPR